MPHDLTFGRSCVVLAQLDVHGNEA